MTEWFADRSWRALGVALSRPRRVLAIGLAVAVVGLALDTQSEVVSDVRELVPQDLQALRDVNALQDETGVSGEIDVTVRADDITDPKVIAWMTRFQNRVLRAHGYRAGKRCTQKRNAPELCPALSLPDLFSTGRRQAQVRHPARRGAALLLPGRRDRRPHDRQPRLRDPADAARPPEAGGGRHQGARSKPPDGRERVGGRPARARGGGERRAVLAVAPRRSRCSPRWPASSSCCSPRAARRARRPSR